jgi:hypothetical protein
MVRRLCASRRRRNLVASGRLRPRSWRRPARPCRGRRVVVRGRPCYRFPAHRPRSRFIRPRNRLAAATVLFVAAAWPAAAQEGSYWGAVAIGEGDAWAFAINLPNREAARAAALGNCQGKCGRVLTFFRACGAYATAPRGAFAWAVSPLKDDAQSRALLECNTLSRSGPCRVRAWACTDR